MKHKVLPWECTYTLHVRDAWPWWNPSRFISRDLSHNVLSSSSTILVFCVCESLPNCGLSKTIEICSSISRRFNRCLWSSAPSRASKRVEEHSSSRLSAHFNFSATGSYGRALPWVLFLFTPMVQKKSAETKLFDKKSRSWQAETVHNWQELPRTIKLGVLGRGLGTIRLPAQGLGRVRVALEGCSEGLLWRVALKGSFDGTITGTINFTVTGLLNFSGKSILKA